MSPSRALADVPIFFVFAWVRVALWWTILLAIGIEALALHLLFALTWRRALWAAVLVNVGTAALGFIAYPLVGTLSYPALAPLVMQTFGTGQIVEIAAYCIAAAIIDTPIELGLLALLSRAAGYGVRIGGKAAAVFFVANLLSAAVLFTAIQIGPRQHPVDAETRRLLDGPFNEEVALVATIFDELSRHRDAEGNIDEAWRAALKAQAEGLDFVQLEIATGGRIYPIVAMPTGGIGTGMTFTYEDDRYDGAAMVTRGTVQRYGASPPGAPRDVLHYRLFAEDAAHPYSVQAILPFP
ncbi:hypothetical protein [Thetidibacter halocola]|uniref:hypothetical protein n=1 Tax=Thetidibacter halocola TaxID=2827239 RepID=UPI001BA4CE55|nr:hypothetical protein [Thetidibacter halocola]